MTNEISTNPIPNETNKSYNAYCFDQKCLDYFDDDIKVTDPTNVNMKVEF